MSLTDAVLLLWITIAQACLFAIIYERGNWSTWIFLGIAVGIAGLTKGPGGDRSDGRDDRRVDSCSGWMIAACGVADRTIPVHRSATPQAAMHSRTNPSTTT